MPKLDREQAISVAALALLLLLCVSVLGLLLQARSDAVREASERREMLSRLEARLRTNSNRPTAVAPPAAFLDAFDPRPRERAAAVISGAIGRRSARQPCFIRRRSCQARRRTRYDPPSGYA